MKYLLIFIISFSVAANTFVEEYSFMIEDVQKDIEKNCKKKIKKNIIYKWMPKGLEPMEASLAFVSFHDEENWIEFRSNFKQLSYKDRKLILYHEIGHIYGLEHKKKSIMTNPIQEVVEDYESFFSELCHKMP